MKFKITRDSERYGNSTYASKELPKEFIVEGFSLEQVENLCYHLSLLDAGCNDQFYFEQIFEKD